MLEDLALQYVGQTEGGSRAISYGLVIIGAIIAGYFTKSKSEIARAPYFAFGALLFLAVAGVQFVWLESVSAIAGGYLWVLMTVDLLSSLALGFFTCQIAMARSRDAYGDARNAVLAFIPVANLFLLFKPSKRTQTINPVPTIPLLTGGLGVFIGFVMFAAAFALIGYLRVEIERQTAAASTQPRAQKIGMDFLLKSQGLEGTLRTIATEFKAPVVLDAVTTLARIETANTQLRRVYLVSGDNQVATGAFRSAVESNICAHPAFIPLLRAGASIREVYLQRDGKQIGAILVTREVCGI